MERSMNGPGPADFRMGEADRLFTIGEACLQASLFLERHEITEPRSNSELLLMHLLGLEKAGLLRDWRDPFPVERSAEWESLISRKAAGEPAQYLIGEQWFYGLPFAVTPAVLIPRPETELLVEAVLAEADRLWPEASGAGSRGAGQGGEAAVKAGGSRTTGAGPSEIGAVAGDESRQVGEAAAEANSESGTRAALTGRTVSAGVPTVLDVGTGSGAIGVTLAVQRPLWRVSASDLSPDALEVARTNAARHGAAARMAFVQGDLLAPFRLRREGEPGAPGGENDSAGLRIDVLVSNPPYIPAGDIAGLQPEVRDHEPRLALDGGGDGLDPYRRMLEQLPRLAQMPRIIAFELGMGQAREVARLLEQLGEWDEVRIIDDYAGIERHVIAVNNRA
ncbi:N5-glutamine methyltransferase family protein [Paenibacillus sepulcri]